MGTYSNCDTTRRTRCSAIPLRERVLDRMADILLSADEILGEVEGEPQSFELPSEIVKTIRTVFDDVNSLMRQLSD